MIEQLKIKNVALARNVSLDFVNGFNVLLGETGAGKSIILDALNFVIGGKADKGLITSGEQTMRVEATFSNLPKEAISELEELGFESDDKLIIVRTLNQEGKSDIKINGSNATLSMLKSITKYLVDSYSQHENLLLLKQKNHIDILDNFKSEYILEEKEKLSNLVLNHKQVLTQIDEIGGNQQNRERLIDLLQYQVNEIESINPSLKEEEELTEKLSKYSNSEKIAQSLFDASSALDGSQFSAIAQIKNTYRSLGQISGYSQEYQNLYERLTSILYEIEDIAYEIKRQADGINFDERELEKIDARLDKYKSLKKKYGGSVEKVLEFLQKTKIDLDNLLNSEEKLQNLEKQKTELEKQIFEVCKQLSDKRSEIAKEIENKIAQELAMLGMKNARFVVGIKQDENFTKNGFDIVEFLFSANIGEELKPLAKIISGGEMSRFMLAIKNIIAGENSCLVFDEVDSGISGTIGAAVAERIAKLSKNNQVICISHSAQVCAMADSFFYVSKSVEDGKTTTTVKNIYDDEVLNQLANLSAGKVSNEISKAHANELLIWAQNFKNSI